MNLIASIPSLIILIVLMTVLNASNSHAQSMPATQSLDRSAYIRTPAASAGPRINGAGIVGARVNRPFTFHIPVTGDRPIQLVVTNLPSGLTFDASRQEITGKPTATGEFAVQIKADNHAGATTATLRIVVGQALALTPPMGWNNYNAFRMRIDDKLIRRQADAMVATGLIEHGYMYMNIDDGWQGQRDSNGAIHGSEKFPDMKALGDYIHSLGLKFGLYSSPGHKTCAGFEGSLDHEDQDAATYAGWGVDFLKYDWCYYERVSQRRAAAEFGMLLPAQAKRLAEIVEERIPLIESRVRPRPAEQQQRIKSLSDEFDAIISAIPAEKRDAVMLEIYVRPYRVFGESLAKVDRDIVYSLCQYGRGNVVQWGPGVGGNLYRTTGDITPTWKRISAIIEQQVGLEKYAGPGHWNDPDMLEIGNGQLTPDEMHMQMTQWCMLAAPLLIGTDLTKADELTLSIFRNDEVIAIDQDPLGMQGRRLSRKGDFDLWIKPCADGALAVAMFNRGEARQSFAFSPADLGMATFAKVRDLWRQKDCTFTDRQEIEIAAHGVEMFNISGK